MITLERCSFSVEISSGLGVLLRYLREMLRQLTRQRDIASGSESYDFCMHWNLTARSRHGERHKKGSLTTRGSVCAHAWASKKLEKQ